MTPTERNNEFWIEADTIMAMLCEFGDWAVALEHEVEEVEPQEAQANG